MGTPGLLGHGHGPQDTGQGETWQDREGLDDGARARNQGGGAAGGEGAEGRSRGGGDRARPMGKVGRAWRKTQTPVRPCPCDWSHDLR